MVTAPRQYRKVLQLLSTVSSHEMGLVHQTDDREREREGGGGDGNVAAMKISEQERGDIVSILNLIISVLSASSGV